MEVLPQYNLLTHSVTRFNNGSPEMQVRFPTKEAALLYLKDIQSKFRHSDTTFFRYEELTNNEPEHIICAAIRLNPSGYLYYGHRHADCIQVIYRELLSYDMLRLDRKYEQYKDKHETARNKYLELDLTQGFVTSKNRFVDREEALEIMKNNNPDKEYNHSMLFSEDIY